MTRALATAVAAAAAAACGSFEDPAIVLDLRVLAMTATPPEQVIPLDPMNPPDPTTVQLDPVEICAQVADPAEDRGLEWSMRLCPVGAGLRCAPGATDLELAEGVIADPEVAWPEPRPCAVHTPGPLTFLMLEEALRDDPLTVFAGIDLQVELRVAPLGAPAEEVVAGKRIRFSAQLPPERVANTNPTVDWIMADTGPGTDSFVLPLGRCGEAGGGVTIRSTERVRMLPVEPEGVREDYVLPTYDGQSRMFTENLRYQWLAGDGRWTSNTTGGPKDAFGNEPDLQTAWVPPDDLVRRTDVPIWIVQRDERLGAAWTKSCITVVP